MTPEKIKTMRISLGLTVTQAASMVHINTRSWQRYESGERKIPDGIVELFCIKCGIEYPLELKK